MENRKRILDFKNFVVNESLLHESNTIDIPTTEIAKILDRDMSTYLKARMWEKSIEVFFGKEYVKKPGFNPENDTTPITVANWIAGNKSVDAGGFFRDAWQETDQFCDRAVELVKTGEISDFLGKIAVPAGWAGITAATVAGLIAIGGIAIPSATIASGFVSAAGGLGWGGIAVNISALGALGLNLAPLLVDNPKVDSDVQGIAKMVANKQETIKTFQNALQGHSDFEGDWGLDNWLSGIDDMPGWSKSTWKQRGEENIGYLFTYWISYYSYLYLKTKFGASVAQAIQNFEQGGGKVSLMDKPFEPNKPMAVEPISKPSGETSTSSPIDSPFQAKVGAEGATDASNWVKKKEVTMNDDILSKYGF